MTRNDILGLKNDLMASFNALNDNPRDIYEAQSIGAIVYNDKDIIIKALDRLLEVTH